MKRWSRKRLTNLEGLIGLLIVSLVLYLGTVVPNYIRILRSLKETEENDTAFVQILKAYKEQELEWEQQSIFLDLCLKGYDLDFPQAIDAYTLLDQIEDYFKKNGVKNVEVVYLENQEGFPFQHHRYSIRYESDEKRVKDIGIAFLNIMEGITIKNLRIRLISTEKESYTTELVIDVACR